jgi:hypothetical protein
VLLLLRDEGDHEPRQHEENRDRLAGMAGDEPGQSWHHEMPRMAQHHFERRNQSQQV